MKTFLTFCCLLCVLITASLPLSAQQVPITAVSDEGSPVVAVAQTSDGFIWFSVYGLSISRFDGTNQKTFAAPAGVFGDNRHLVEDKRGHLWVGGKPYQGNGGGLRVSSVSVLGGVLPGDLCFRERMGNTQLVTGNVADVAVDHHGQIWAVADSMTQVYRWAGDSSLVATTISSSGRGRFPQPGLTVIPLEDGSVWITFEGNTSYRLELDPVTNDVTLLDSIKMASNGSVQLDCVDGSGQLWGRGFGSEYLRLPAKADAFIRHPAGGRVQPILELNDRTMLLLSQDLGLVLLDRERGEKIRQYGLDDGLPTVTIFNAVLSDAGDLWLATLTGLYRMPADFFAFDAYTPAAHGNRSPLLTEPNVNVLLDDVKILAADGRETSYTLVGTMDGLLLIPESGSVRKLGTAEGLPIKVIVGAAKDEAGGIYLTSLNQEIAYLHPDGKPHPKAKSTVDLPTLPGYSADLIPSWKLFLPSLLTMPGGEQESIWGGLSNRVMCLANGEGEKWMEFTSASGYSGGGPARIHQDDQGFIHALNETGWYRSLAPFTAARYRELATEENLNVAANHYQITTAFFERVDLAHDGVDYPAPLSSLIVDGKMWVGVDTFLLVLDPADGRVEKAVFFKGAGHLCTALSDGGDLVWAGTAGGLYGIRKGDFSIAQYVRQEDGLLQSNNWTPVGLAATKSGKVFQATSAGLQVLTPGKNQPDTFRHPIYLTELAFVEDGWGRNELSVAYAMLSYRELPDAIRYQTRLLGDSEEWTAPSPENKLRFTNLRAFGLAKTYQMEVRAVDYRGNVAQSLAGAYPIRVSPPLYFRWWAILLYLALLALLFQAVLKDQLRRQEKELKLQEAAVVRIQRDEIAAKNAENETLLKEIHHRVKNNLEVVSSLLELQSVTLADAGARDAMLAGRSRVATMGILHQKLYQGDNLGTVGMREYITDLTRNLGHTFGVNDRVAFTIDIPEDLRLDVDTAVPLGLIANELITNSIKYAFGGTSTSSAGAAAAGAVTVEMSKVGERHLLAVSDNGSGKTGTSVGGTGFGTRLVGMLVQQIEGELSEQNAEGLRTEIGFSTAR